MFVGAESGGVILYKFTGAENRISVFLSEVP